ncbi:MAG: hypothetical protein HY298_18725 [Verrucomicrobia bacterium]|nr:hypothetical protein [Verrucomicrobiota bacterium]
MRPTTELSDAGGPAGPHWQLTWPACVRSSDLVGPTVCMIVSIQLVLCISTRAIELIRVLAVNHHIAKALGGARLLEMFI